MLPDYCLPHPLATKVSNISMMSFLEGKFNVKEGAKIETFVSSIRI